MSDLSDIPAVILAGGFGTRLRSAVADRPKVLANVGGRPFLAWQLDLLIEAGLRRVVLCTGYRGEMVRAAFSNRYRNLAIEYSHESTPLGTGGALRAALPLINLPAALVLNGDSICPANLTELADAHRERQAAVTLLLTRVDEASRYGRVAFDNENCIVQFVEKGHAGPGWINAGTYLIERPVVEDISPDGNVSLEREVFPKYLGRGLYGHPTPAPFLDIGTPESLAAAEEFCRMAPLAPAV